MDWNPVKIVRNVGTAIKKGVSDLGHEVGRAASNPWVQGALATGLAATGVGAPAAAGIMAATRGGGALLKPGGNIGAGLRGGVEGAALGATAGGIGSALRGGGSFLSKAGNIAGLARTAGSAVGGAVPALAGGAGSLAGLASGNGRGGNIHPAILALAAAQGVNAASLGKKANDFSDSAWSLANDSYTSRAPLREKGMAGLMAPQSRDLSSLSALRAQNPVAQRAGLRVG